jgi:DNA-binding transcriptional regulator GbsR (MarR family)
MLSAPIQVSNFKLQVSSAGSLSELEIEAIDLFISFMKLIGLPKSVGEIYGLLFVAGAPLNAEQITERLQISVGATSQGLKLLRSLGAVRSVYVAGDRRDHFVADLDLSTFASAFIKEELNPRLEHAAERIERMEFLAQGLEGEEREAAFKRIERLRHWMERGRKMMPWLLKFLVN